MAADPQKEPCLKWLKSRLQGLDFAWARKAANAVMKLSALLIGIPAPQDADLKAEGLILLTATPSMSSSKIMTTGSQKTPGGAANSAAKSQMGWAVSPLGGWPLIAGSAG